MSTFSDLEPGPTIYWPAGTSARWRLTIRQCKTCPALDLSGDGVEVEFVLKRSATASDATAKFTKKLSTGGIVAVDLALGIVDVIIDADDTVAANGVGSWFYTTRVTLEDGEILQPFGLSGAARLDLTVPTDAPVVAADSTSGTIDPVSLTPAPLPAYATIAYVTTAVAAEATLRAAADTANATALALKAPLASPTFTGPLEASGNITSTGGDLRAPNGSMLADGITLTNGTDILDILRSNTGSRELQLPADLDAKAPADSPTFTTIATLPSPTRVGTSTSGTIGGPGQGGGYSYTPALTVSGGAIISSSSGETLIQNTISGLVHSDATLCRNNVLAIQNLGTTDTGRPLPSAIRFLGPNGAEYVAVGYSPDTVWAPFAQTGFISFTQPYTQGGAPAAPTRGRILQEGLYGGAVKYSGGMELMTDWTIRFLTPLDVPILTMTPTAVSTFSGPLTVSGVLSAGTTPTTLTDAAGKILSAALNTVAVAQGGTGTTTSTGTGSVVLSASPALTGTPTAPTAAAGTNTTQIATTAAALLAMMDPGFVDLTGYTAWTIASSGAGVANAQSAVNIRLTGPTTAAGYITARTAFSASPIWTKATTAGNGYTFTTQTIVSARIFVESRDANSVWRMSFGKNFSSSNGVLAAKGFGIRQAASGALYLVVHDGTTLTEVASSYTPDTATPFDVRLDNMGNGTVTLYVNGAQVATTALGPVGTGLATPGLWMEVENTNTVTTQPATTFARQKLWFAS